MTFFRVAMAQINPTVGDVEKNAGLILRDIERARKESADVVVFPELAVSGYPPEDLLLKPSFVRECKERVNSLAEACKDIIAVVGFPEMADDLHNAAAVLADGRVIGTYRKHFLPNYSVFDEDRYFLPGNGNQVFTVGNVRFGVTVCEDMWYPTGPHEAQAIQGNAQLLINISASPYHREKPRLRERMLGVRASDAVACLAFCNLVGGQDELVFDGGSLAFDATGRTVARAAQFEADLLVVDFNLGDVEHRRLHDPRRRKALLNPNGSTTGVIRLPLPHSPRGSAHTRQNGGPIRPWRDGASEVYQALVLGTRDYIEKNGFRSVVLGLSGGVDSALVACIAADALGPSNVNAVFMPSQYSTDESRRDAVAVAKALGIRLLEIGIQNTFTSFLNSLKGPFGSAPPNVAEENLQARIRGTILMALSNKFGHLVLSTGNKSEGGVGYATLYGDMAGGFAVIKDASKALVYELCRYRNSVSDVIPLNVLVKAPTAELREGQKDTDSLPPYEQLDPILEAHVERDYDLQEVVALGNDKATARNVLRMVQAAEYKRRQAAPGVRITPRAFGKDRRFPITNRYEEDGV